jgi:HNH endonuclease
MRDHLTIRQITHREYLQSPLWRSIRLKAIEHYGEICGKCGGYGNDVHHLTYDRVGGEELLEDLQVLCRDCHEAIHAMERATRSQKTKRRGCTIEVLYSMLTDEHKKQIEDKYSGNAYSVLTAPSRDGWQARKMARRFVNIQFIVGNLNPSYPVDKRQINAINQFFYRQEYQSLKESGMLTGEIANSLRKKYFSC